MHIVVYGTKSDYDACISCLGAVPRLQYRRVLYTHAEDYDSLIRHLGSQDAADLIIVTVDGAEGMEGAMASKRLRDDVPVIWISDDANFGVQSHRLGCTFFAVKPITEQVMANAIHHYRQERV